MLSTYVSASKYSTRNRVHKIVFILCLQYNVQKVYLSHLGLTNKSNISVSFTEHMTRTRNPQKARSRIRKMMSVQHTFLRACRRSFGRLESTSSVGYTYQQINLQLYYFKQCQHCNCVFLPFLTLGFYHCIYSYCNNQTLTARFNKPCYYTLQIMHCIRKKFTQ